jgi:hypothetical protein
MKKGSPEYEEAIRKFNNRNNVNQETLEKLKKMGFDTSKIE